MNKHDDRQQRVTALEAAQQAHLKALAERVADRPAHRRYFDRLLAATDDALYDVALPAKRSQRAADALIQDVAWCREQLPEAGQLSAYPGAYEALRLADARAASRRGRSTFERDLQSVLTLRM